VTEAGVRVAGERAHRVDKTDQPELLEIVKLRSVEFRLTLLNSEDIRVTVENFTERTDTNPENDSHLMRTALYTSGVASALHVLEAVAAEGRDWINRERERRERGSQDLYGGR
jgi:hypothetical protein